MLYNVYCPGILANRRCGSPIENQHRTMVNSGGTYKNNNSIRCVYLLQCRSTQYRIFALISACTYTLSINRNVVQNVLSYLSKSLFMIKLFEIYEFI